MPWVEKVFPTWGDGLCLHHPELCESWGILTRGTGITYSSPVWTRGIVTVIFWVPHSFASRCLLRCMYCSVPIINEGPSTDSGRFWDFFNVVFYSTRIPENLSCLVSQTLSLLPSPEGVWGALLGFPSLNPALKVCPGSTPGNRRAHRICLLPPGDPCLSLPDAHCPESLVSKTAPASCYLLYQRVSLIPVASWPPMQVQSHKFSDIS